MSETLLLRRFLLTLAGAACLFLGVPAAAGAGSYDVFSCRTPDGARALLQGWTGTGNAAAGAYVQNGCGSGLGYFTGEIAAGPAARNQPAQWRFDAPVNTRIEHYTLFRSVRSTAAPGGGKGYGFFEDEATLDQEHVIEFCTTLAPISCTSLGDENSPFSEANRLTRSGRDARRLLANETCGSYTSCGASSTSGRFRIYQAQIGLEDGISPSLSGLDGDLVRRQGAVGGSGSVGFSASDLGGGVERAELLVDGSSVVVQGMEGQGAGCRRPFTAVVPCPLATSVELPFDTTRLADGLHRVQAQVTDAGGNVGRSAPVFITTKNATAPVVATGAGADRRARLAVSFRGRAARTVRFGRTERATGRLTSAAGRPIAGAYVGVYARVAQPGARWRGVAVLRTGSTGRFRYRPRRGASRGFRFVYRAYSSDRRPAAARTLRLRVRAGIRLSITPRALRNGRTATFRVRLLGGPGRGGTLVSVQVLRPQRTTFATRGAGRGGVARVLHRFRYTYRPTTYSFRAVVQPQRGYPYLGAASGVVKLRVRP